MRKLRELEVINLEEGDNIQDIYDEYCKLLGKYRDKYGLDNLICEYESEEGLYNHFVLYALIEKNEEDYRREKILSKLSHRHPKLYLQFMIDVVEDEAPHYLEFFFEEE